MEKQKDSANYLGECNSKPKDRLGGRSFAFNENFILLKILAVFFLCYNLKNFSKGVIIMATQQEVINAFMKSLDTTNASGSTALDNAVKACSNFKSIQSVINQLISDCQNANSAEDFLLEKCGIVLGNEDTGAITGFDAGGSAVKNADDVVPENGSASYPSSTIFTKRGLLVSVPEKNSLTTDEQNVVKGLYSWWIEEGLKLIEESYGYSFYDTDATVTTITLKFINDSSVYANAYVSYRYLSNKPYKTYELSLTVNMHYFEGITLDDPNVENHLDRTISHELTHAIMAAKINNYDSLPGFILEGMAELTHGIDYERPADIRQLAANPSKLESLLNVNVSSGLNINTLTYAAGYIFLRYLAKQASDDKDYIPENAIYGTEGNDSLSNHQNDKMIIYGYGGSDTITNTGSDVTINAGAGNDSIVNYYGERMTINGGAGADTISNSSSNVSINAGAGNDSIQNYYGNHMTLNGGEGNDSISNSSSYAIIFGDAGDDSIQNYSGNQMTINGGAGNDSITNSSSNVKISGDDGNDYIYSYYSDDITLNGGTGDDSIEIYDVASVTINGGAGNDSINLFDSTIVLLNYAAGDGNDVIYGFDKNSTLSITGGSYTSVKSGSNVVLTVGTGNITLLGAANSSNLNIIGNYDTTPADTTPADTTPADTTPADTTPADTTPADTTPADTTPADTTPADSTILIVTNSDSSPVTVNSSIKTIDASSRTKAVKIFGNDKANSIIGGTKADTLDGGAGNDTLTGGKGNDVFVYTAGKDVITDYASGDKISISAAIKKETVKGSDVVLTIGSGKLTIKDAADKKLSIVGGGSSSSGSLNSTTVKLTNSDSSTFTAGDKVKVIDASSRTKAIKIVGNSKANTITGGSKNDTLTGGKGKDVFVYTAGKDVITDYAAGDKISVSAAIKKETVKGSDVVLTIGKGSLTIKDAADKKFSIIGGGSSSGGSSNSTTVKLTNSDKSPFTAGDKTKTIDASDRTKAVQIFGNSKANSIVGGTKNDKLHGGAGNDSLWGGKGNDSLWGGKGNDTLWGDAGKDTFIYNNGDGKDIIYGFENNDLLKITGAFSASYNSSKNEIAFKVGSDSITLKEFTATTFNVNGDKYKINGSSLVKN